MKRATRASAIAGFTIIEVMVAIVVLTVVAVSLGLVIERTTAVTRRSRLELGATTFLLAESARLRQIPWDSLTSDSLGRGDSVASWTVTDSAAVRRIVLVTAHTSPTGSLVARDSVLIVRRRTP